MLLFLKNTSHILSCPKPPWLLWKLRGILLIVRGEGEEREAIVGAGPPSGAVEECRHAEQ